jgi:uncharacterized protein YbaR (Trm112 family)
MITDKLLSIIACPICKGELEYDRENNRLICKRCKKAYPIEDDIPILLEEAASNI